jgi:hypothetical protein
VTAARPCRARPFGLSAITDPPASARAMIRD